MIVVIDVGFWDMVGRLADITWLIAFGSADVWVVFAGWRALRNKWNKANAKAR